MLNDELNAHGRLIEQRYHFHADFPKRTLLLHLMYLWINLVRSVLYVVCLLEQEPMLMIHTWHHNTVLFYLFTGRKTR